MSGTETSFTAVSFLGGDFFPERFLFLVGPTSDRLTGADVTIGGFVLDGGTNGKKSNGACVGLDRVGGATIARNVITRTSHAVFARASTAVLRGNLIHDCYTGGILQAGSAASPSKYVFQDNRSVRHTEGGLVPQATGIVHVMDPALTPVPANALYDVNQVAVIHNDLSDSNAVKGWSTGIRCMMFTPALAAGQVPGHLTVDIKRNRIAGNSVGIHVDAGFPWRSFAEPLTATFRGEFADNEVTANDTAPALLTFTRNTTGLKQTPSELNWNKYLTDSLYELTVADDELEGFLYDNPTNDPVSGVALGNTLLVNGVELVGRNID
jgi:hypothetical protein